MERNNNGLNIQYESMIIVSSNPTCPKKISFKYLNERQADINHMQSLTTLNRRGGMSAMEIIANIEEKSFIQMKHDLYDKEYYVNKLIEFLKNKNEENN